MSDDKKSYHDQGEKDGAEGNYNPPDPYSIWGKTDEREAYDKGFTHGKGQSDGSKNEYDSYYKNTESYNKGWDNGYESSGGSGK